MLFRMEQVLRRRQSGWRMALWTALSAPPFGEPFVTAPHG
jgi:hypothetical protein